ncbi:murein hydrolase activator EnvC family protein [Amphibacillus sp. Q70]|uniref:murein hydrolase activator EnvC family protein n=1 Tax=Amphibacillus sp. Q70 TaxID=3453416 RepID=UPI003F854B6E
MKRFFAYILIVTLSLGIVGPGVGSVSAQSIAELEKELEELENERSGIDNEASDAQAQIAENERRQAEVTEKISEIDGDLEVTETNLEEKQNEIDITNTEISTLEGSITETETQINDTEEELDTLADEIEELIDRIEERDVLIKNRLRSIQHNGGNINYLQVLFGAQSFSDFVNRATAVTKIFDSDRTIMEAQQQDQADLEDKRVTVEEKKEQLVADKTKLDDQKAELENQRSTLVAQQQELSTLQDQLNQQRDTQVAAADELEEEHADLEEYTITLADQQEIKRTEAVALEKAIKLAEEEERLAQLTQEDKKQDDTSEQVVDSGATLFWPASTRRVTSEFNPSRVHPITGEVKPHNGIDIAEAGNQEIYAAEAGVVQGTYTEGGPSMRGYGDAIMITHYINGQQITTFYAHLRSGSISVSPGDTVSRGQKIAMMGNTGGSTGQHLHFEVHIGGWGNPQNPRNFLQ